MSGSPHPKDDNLIKHALVVFVVCLIAYVGLYKWDNHLRARYGPWEITFAKEADGTPFISIDQEQFAISNVVIRFPDCEITETNLSLPTLVKFDVPMKQPPIGKLRFRDLTYQPGTVTLLLFNHEIEMIRRGLFIDRQEHRWEDAKRFSLTPTNAPPPAHEARRKQTPY
ncbi:MAG: hypothetical protein CMO80_00750 [Verrucomicrobiales bacterium]|nr:hypothetical protein [Verrucomicrobiales bacterium]|tara:strand:- start:26 stop:532 length:507 start_codon:yes stop_codon:yes gene_type:complete